MKDTSSTLIMSESEKKTRGDQERLDGNMKDLTQDYMKIIYIQKLGIIKTSEHLTIKLHVTPSCEIQVRL